MRGHRLPEFGVVPVGFGVRGELANGDVARACAAHIGEYTGAQLKSGTI
jgi:hypothetical protein